MKGCKPALRKSYVNEKVKLEIFNDVSIFYWRDREGHTGVGKKISVPRGEVVK